MGEEARPLPRSENRRRETEILFEIELLLHRWGVSDFIFDEEGQVFRDREGGRSSAATMPSEIGWSAENSETAG